MELSIREAKQQKAVLAWMDLHLFVCRFEAEAGSYERGTRVLGKECQAYIRSHWQADLLWYVTFRVSREQVDVPWDAVHQASS